MHDGSNWDMVAYVHCEARTHCTLELVDNPLLYPDHNTSSQVWEFTGTDGEDSATAKLYRKIADIQTEFTVFVNSY